MGWRGGLQRLCPASKRTSAARCIPVNATPCSVGIATSHSAPHRHPRTEPICTGAHSALSSVSKCRTSLGAAYAIALASLDAGGASACTPSPTQLCHGPCQDWRARLQWVVYEYLKRIASQRRTLVGESVCAR